MSSFCCTSPCTLISPCGAQNVGQAGAVDLGRIILLANVMPGLDERKLAAGARKSLLIAEDMLFERHQRRRPFGIERHASNRLLRRFRAGLCMGCAAMRGMRENRIESASIVARRTRVSTSAQQNGRNTAPRRRCAEESFFTRSLTFATRRFDHARRDTPTR